MVCSFAIHILDVWTFGRLLNVYFWLKCKTYFALKHIVKMFNTVVGHVVAFIFKMPFMDEDKSKKPLKKHDFS